MGQIHVLRCVIEDSAVFSLIPRALVFVDFKKAFDSIIRSIMLQILRSYGIPKKIVRAIGLLYNNTKSYVLVGDGVSKSLMI